MLVHERIRLVRLPLALTLCDMFAYVLFEIALGSHREGAARLSEHFYLIVLTCGWSLPHRHAT